MWIECNPLNLGKCRYLTDSGKISGMTAELQESTEVETRELAGSGNSQPERGKSGRFLSGNTISRLGGRPKKGSRVSDYVESYSPRTNKQIAKSLAKQAEKGSIRHIEAVLAYQSGLPVKRVQVTSDSPLLGILGIQEDSPGTSFLPADAIETTIRELPAD